jgi:hypothetical protein
MNKQQLAVHLFDNGCTLEIEQIEELLESFLNNEKAKVRPKIDLLGAGIIEPSDVELIVKGNPETAIFQSKYFIEPTDIDRVTDEQL